VSPRLPHQLLGVAGLADDVESRVLEEPHDAFAQEHRVLGDDHPHGIVAPALADQLSGGSTLTRALLITLTGGLVWQGVLVAGLVYREQGTLRWSVIRDALWLRAPRNPKTGRRGGRLWLILIPLILAFGVEALIPSVSHSSARDFGEFVSSHAGHVFLSGAWGWSGLITVLLVFNTVLGEELLFRGYLLPRMEGVFGRCDWLANGLLFAAYHLHVPWAIPATLLDTFIIAYPSKRYRSALVGIVVHSVQSVFFFVGILALVLK
jgi:CAAX protease family protein